MKLQVIFWNGLADFPLSHVSHIHSVRCLVPPASQQYFSLTQLQHQPPATSQPTVFFSHTTPAPATSTSTANRVIKVFFARSLHFVCAVQYCLSSLSTYDDGTYAITYLLNCYVLVKSTEMYVESENIVPYVVLLLGVMSQTFCLY